MFYFTWDSASLTAAIRASEVLVAPLTASTLVVWAAMIASGICAKAGVPLQFFANRSDMQGGSTLGNIAMSQVSMNAVDIGLPQLSMHSAYETAGVRDCAFMIQAVEAFFNSGISEYTLRR